MANDKTAVIAAVEKCAEIALYWKGREHMKEPAAAIRAYAAALRQESGVTHNVKCPDCGIIFDAQWEEKDAAYRAALRQESGEVKPDRACHHGWRGSYVESQIVTPCPACGAKSLFIGDGGHLTCARVPNDFSDGCNSPSVEDTVNALKKELAALKAAHSKAEADGMPTYDYAKVVAYAKKMGLPLDFLDNDAAAPSGKDGK